MAMKSRVLTVTKKAKMKTLADKISARMDCYKPVDIIPPAYSCDRERVVVIVLTAAKTMPDDFRRFVQNLSREKTQNLAFVADGTPALMAPIMYFAKTAGSNVIDNVLYVDGGSALPFLGAKVKPEEEKAAMEWCDSILEIIK